MLKSSSVYSNHLPEMAVDNNHLTDFVGHVFSGVSARVMKVAPACAIMISTYEYSKSFFRQYNMENASDL